MTKLCGSCGEGLRDSDRFCDSCGAAQPKRSTRPESYRKPAESLPKTEVDSLMASLVARIGDLEAKLAEAYKLHVRLRQLETLLAESIPRREAKAEADSLRVNVAQLQDRLAGSVPKAELETRVNELETFRKTIEDLKERLSGSSAKIEELQSNLSDSVPRSELETIKSQLESNIVDLKAKLAASIPRSEAEELRTGTSVASRPGQTSTRKAGQSKCPLCKYKNRPDAIFCASCGHKLEDEKEELKLITQSQIERSSLETTPKTAHVGRLSKLKSLLGSRFESRKKHTSHTPNVQPVDKSETELTKLKSLYESGALTETEYQREKKKPLSNL